MWMDGYVRAGIIPAYAGSTVSSMTPPTHAADHPRVCGEHENARVANTWDQGSSPRMRGAHHERGAVRLAAGIIPAYAGSTSESR